MISTDTRHFSADAMKEVYAEIFSFENNWGQANGHRFDFILYSSRFLDVNIK